MTDVGEIIKQYIICRDGLKALSDKFKDDSAPYRTAMSNMESKIMRLASDQNVDSFKTKHGTAFKSKTFKIKVVDWSTALSFIITNDLTHILTKSVAKAAVSEYMDENNGELPPGLEKDTWVNLNVRRK